MDREYRTPESAARAGSERVHQTLSTILRRGFDDRPFLLRLQFDFAGRAAPVLFIGTINRAWRDYINSNARANDLVAGNCSTGRGDTGRILIKLRPERGRGVSASNLLNLNRVLRSLNAEVVFEADANDVTAGAGIVVPNPRQMPSAPAPASTVVDIAEPQATARADDIDATAVAEVISGDGRDEKIVDAAVDVANVPAPQPSGAELMESARALRELFAAFKAQPSAAGLEAMNNSIAQFRLAIASGVPDDGANAVDFVDKLATVLAAKGSAFVAQKSD